MTDLISQERSYVTYSLGQPDFPLAAYQRLIQVLARMEVYQKSFETWSSTELKALFIEKMNKGIGKTAKSQRYSILNYDPEMGFDIRPDVYIKVWNTLIKEMLTIQKQVFSSLENWTEALLEENSSLVKQHNVKKKAAIDSQKELNTKKETNQQEIASILTRKKLFDHIFTMTSS